MFFNLTQLGLLDPIKSVLKPDSQSQSEPSCLAHTLSPKPLPEHNGSYRKYVDIMRKHQRNAKGPNDLYTHTITSSQAYGRWLVEHPNSSSRDDSWITNPGRFHHRNSEMTRYVDDYGSHEQRLQTILISHLLSVLTHYTISMRVTSLYSTLSDIKHRFYLALSVRDVVLVDVM